MGKKRRLNKFISKWIKSDLPKDKPSTVLLLSVTRIPSSPVPIRSHHQSVLVEEEKLLLRKGSFGRGRIIRRSSSRKTFEGRRLQVPTVKVTSLAHIVNVGTRTETCFNPLLKGEDAVTPTAVVKGVGVSVAPSSQDLFNDNCSIGVLSSSQQVIAMERSVDSIGNCSLDVDASADVTDWSEVSSVGTLRSASIVTPSPEPHLPSYLGLACTVNGYSTTTNYDSVRLSRSRDVSPHRLNSDLTTNKATTYSVHNNLLSPPNLVPLPIRSNSKENKMENTLSEHRTGEFYSSKTITFLSSKESHFTSKLFIKDTTDGCVENGHHIIQNKCVNFENKNITSFNGQTKCISETTMKQEHSNGKETKSFIQQRVERLYGPGALAQGFFVTKRQKNRLSESDGKSTETDKHSKSMSEKFMEDSEFGPTMKQSTSSPTLPVLRHLRPEFRAQLPIISPKKCSLDGSTIQKSVTIPKLKDDVKVIDHSKVENEINISVMKDTNGTADTTITEESGVKNGHYFIEILENQAKRLLVLAANVESYINTTDLSEEINGKLRSAAGKARLLVTQKMQQFRGLCVNNINQSACEAFPTTNEDLEGFWDMVMLQVDQVDALFKEIETLKNNNWKEVVKPEEIVPSNGSSKTRKTVINRPTKQNSAANDEARKQRELERKKMIEDRRKAMKAQQHRNPRESIEIFVPESS